LQNNLKKGSEEKGNSGKARDLFTGLGGGKEWKKSRGQISGSAKVGQGVLGRGLKKKGLICVTDQKNQEITLK